MVDGNVTQHKRALRLPMNTPLLALGTLASFFGAALLAIAGAVIQPTGASAQYYTSPYGYQGPRYRNNYYYKKRKKRRIRRARKKSKKRRAYAKTLREPVSDVLILVSLKKQRVYVHDKQGLVAEAPISSGRRGMDTPTGIFTILQKNKRHFSNLYAGAPMPNMQRITWSGVAMHGGPLPGYPASHGCIRLPYSFAKTLFGITSMHGRVIVADDPVKPTPIQHSKLFQPLPGGKPYSSEAKVKPSNNVDVAEARSDTRIDSDLGTVIGITPAKAETKVARLDNPKRMQRANKYRKKRLERQARNDKELAAAQTTYELFLIDAKRTADQLLEARNALKAGQAKVAARQKDAKKADVLAQKAHKALKGFDRKYRSVSRRLTGDKLQKLRQQEDELDTRTLRLSDAAEAAHKRVTSAKRRIAGLKSNVALAAQTHTTAKNKLAPTKKRLAAAKAAIDQFKKEEKLRMKPISIFISGKTGRLYARQGWHPVLDVPVTIRNPEVALGTHLFTAIDTVPGEHDLEWNAVTVEDGTTGTEPGRHTRYSRYYGKKRGLLGQRSAPNPAKLALDRIEIPDDARDKIEDVMKSGSSIIISDYPKSNETGKHTDFIILTR